MTKTPHVTAPRATLAMGAVGVVVGGAIAAAKNYDKVKKSEMTREDAVKDVLKESGTTGLATATATAVVGVLNLPGLISLAGIVVVTAGTKRLADRMLERKCAQPALPEQAKEDTVEEKPSKKAKK